VKFSNGIAVISIAAVCGSFSLYGQAQAQPAPVPAEDACARLAGTHLEQVEIESAKVQPADAEVEGAHRPDMTGEPHGAAVSGLQAFCRVIGSIHPTSDSNIRFEVWMPVNGWNGRFFGANNGGFAGSIRYDDLAAAVKNGAAGASTDGGHSSSDRAWSRGHFERVRDYGWRSLHLTTVVAKALVDKYYGRQVEHSYFVGCSNGGRQALTEANRFPEDYDGVVAGAPVTSWTATAMNSLNVLRAQQPPGAAIRPEQAHLIQSEFLKQCDALDGQIDGIVNDPRKCKFDYSKLACGTNDPSLCFTPPQITALKQINAGPHDAAGHRVAWGFPLSGSEVGLGNVGWDTALLSPRGSMINGMLQDLPAAPLGTADNFDFNTDPARLKAALGDEIDTKPDLRRFFDRGGKLILWHGWADVVLQPEGTVEYYNEALRNSGVKAKNAMRLFMIPAISHCSGGTGADAFGQVGAAPPDATPDRSVAAAIVAWVENNRTPEALIGRHGMSEISAGKTPVGPPMERLHCAYPAEPVLKPGADVNSASSYTCVKHNH